MGRIYDNALEFNNGLKIIGQVPVDDRLVLSKYTDVFITQTSFRNCPLYGVAYVGMQISAKDSDGNGVIMVCLDATPYTPHTADNIPEDVNSSNYRKYWSEINIGTIDKIIRSNTWKCVDSPNNQNN